LLRGSWTKVERLSTENGAHLETRKLDVTASVIGALFNCHPHTTPLKLYVGKRGTEFPEVDNKVMRRGRWLEPAIAAAAAEKMPDHRFEFPRVYLRDSDLRLGATPDLFAHGDPRGLCVLQAKSIAPSVFHREWMEVRSPPGSHFRMPPSAYSPSKLTASRRSA
jgi:hypothetical protein